MKKSKLIPGIKYKYRHDVMRCGRKVQAEKYIKCLEVTKEGAVFSFSDDSEEIVTLNNRQIEEQLVEE